MSLSTLSFDILAIGGIFLEILGFLLLLTYDKQARQVDFDKWIKKYSKKHPKWASDMKKLTTYVFKDAYLPEVSNTGGKPIPKRFAEEREKKRQWAIIFVIIGLAAQIMQIGMFDVCEFFGDCVNS